MTELWLVNFLRDRCTQTAKIVQLHTYWGLVLEFTMVVNPKARHTFQLNGAFPYLLTWLTLLCFLFCFDLFLVLYADDSETLWNPTIPCLCFSKNIWEKISGLAICKGENARNHIYKCLPKIMTSFITVTYEHLSCARHSAKCKVMHNPYRTLWCKHYSLSWSYRWGIGLK